MNNLVSIVTPTYNSSKYILDTIKSVQNQTVENFEMLIIDDCSMDNTVELINGIIENDPRIKLFEQTKNQGAAVSRNLGIKMATGKFLAFLDADDIWKPNFIEVSINKIRESGVPFVFSSYERKNEKLEPLLSDFIVPERVSYEDILKSCPISCLTAFIDISVLGKKYMPLVRKRQDFGLWLSYLKTIPYAQGIKKPLAIYRIREDSLSRNKMELIKYQWFFYYHKEKLGLFKSVYYLFNWAIRGFIKYRS
ncbi:glycosyltransferase family 2 protein [Maribacter litopenaei]|uniref:Glycosyltransferase family 2 protein n=1 Tax=Maribacter litopenaei TaxID=2976127 RepID=A0ABY5Y9I7_9FLAO|nr:glycosyltransferase family 2 protein [Maribacter litopenaei]UWX55007.1 glycosyltransferase family 2 protein [Maribacter litopenaei]